MTPQRVSPPRSLRVPQDAVAGVWSGTVRTVHVGQSAVLLSALDGDVLLPVTSGVRGLVPGGVCLPDARELGALAAAAAGPGLLDLVGWAAAVDAAARTDLAVRAGDVDPAAAARLARESGGGPAGETSGGAGHAPTVAGPMDPRPLRARAAPLALAALGDRDRVHRLLRQLVGAGPGSTPSGDDVVVVLLAGLDRAGAARAAGRVRAALRPLLQRTTAVSRHDLAAAIDGQVAERVHVLLAALADPRLVPAAVAAARGWGATSGLDLAAGVAAGAVAGVGAAQDPAVAAAPAPRRTA
jgi:hypothetical protein